MKQPKQVKRVIKKKKKHSTTRVISRRSPFQVLSSLDRVSLRGSNESLNFPCFFLVFCFFFISKRPESGACQCNNITNFPFFANYNNTFGKYNIATKIFYITLFLQDMKIYTCILFYTNGCYKVVGIISCYLFR